MNLALRYDRLTPDERFRLMMAATSRGDETERARLARAGSRITQSVADHSPYGHAFRELALVTFRELVEDASRCANAIDHAIDLVDAHDDTPRAAREKQHPALRTAFDDVSALGYILRTKFDGWSRFCREWHVAPIAPWKPLPGFGRLERAIALTESFAFDANAVHVWCEGTSGKSGELTLTPEAVAADLDAAFRERVAWWGG